MWISNMGSLIMRRNTFAGLTLYLPTYSSLLSTWCPRFLFLTLKTSQAPWIMKLVSNHSSNVFWNHASKLVAKKTFWSICGYIFLGSKCKLSVEHNQKVGQIISDVAVEKETRSQKDMVLRNHLLMERCSRNITPTRKGFHLFSSRIVNNQ